MWSYSMTFLSFELLLEPHFITVGVQAIVAGRTMYINTCGLEVSMGIHAPCNSSLPLPTSLL